MANPPDPVGRESDKFMLRMPDGMRTKLAREAAANSRSMNSEIVTRLEASLNAERFAAIKATEREVDAMLTRAESLALRGDILRLRADGLHTRVMLLAEQASSMAKAAQTDADFAAAEAKVDELQQLEAEIPPIVAEQERLNAERQAYLAQSEIMRGVLGNTAQVLEKSMEKYVEVHGHPDTRTSDVNSAGNDQLPVKLRGKPVLVNAEKGKSSASAVAKKAVKMPVIKMIMVGNLGRDPDIDYMPRAERFIVNGVDMGRMSSDTFLPPGKPGQDPGVLHRPAPKKRKK